MHDHDHIARDFPGYLKLHENKELLRFVAVGSVDDGKSTLIGRLLHDTGAIPEDQLRAARRASRMEGAEIDLSLLTDGLQAEREQGITIDVAYRYFSTNKRKFIIADTPGHVQYTRNMVTGASTAGAGIILIDARLGVLAQSRRHAFLASLLGIPHLVVCVNKMDLREYAYDVFAEIRESFAAYAKRLAFKDVSFIPISALRGDNVVQRSTKTPWYDGPTLLELLESVPVARDRNFRDLRFPVQTVLRPNLDYRAFAGEIASGVVREGDEVLVLPSKKRTRVVGIDVYEGTLGSAFAGQSVALRLADEIDVSRGDLLVHPEHAPEVTDRFEAHLAWMHERPLDPERSYLLKHTTRVVRAQLEAIQHVVDLETLEPQPADASRALVLNLNEVARVTLRSHRPLFLDAYADNRATGAFILIDSLTNETVGAGMVLAAAAPAERAAGVGRDGTQVGARERRARLGHAGAVVRVQGEAGAARALAFTIERQLFDRGHVAAVVEGEALAAAALAVARAGVIAIVLAEVAAAQGIAVATAEVIEGEDVEVAAARAIAGLVNAGALAS
jgi:sulfate adenylyltransferase large subunit